MHLLFLCITGMNTMSSLMCISVFRWIVMYDQVRADTDIRIKIYFVV